MEIDKDILRRAIECYGADNQLYKTEKELLELCIAIKQAGKFGSIHDLDKNHQAMSAISEEIADCLIMLEQCILMLESVGKTDIQVNIDRKLARLTRQIDRTQC